MTGSTARGSRQDSKYYLHSSTTNFRFTNLGYHVRQNVPFNFLMTEKNRGFYYVYLTRLVCHIFNSNVALVHIDAQNGISKYKSNITQITLYICCCPSNSSHFTKVVGMTKENNTKSLQLTTTGRISQASRLNSSTELLYNFKHSYFNCLSVCLFCLPSTLTNRHELGLNVPCAKFTKVETHAPPPHTGRT